MEIIFLLKDFVSFSLLRIFLKGARSFFSSLVADIFCIVFVHGLFVRLP